MSQAGQIGSADTSCDPGPVPTRIAYLLGVFGLALFGICAWAMSGNGASGWQVTVMRWLNQPPSPVAGILAVINPLLRPVPLTVLTVLLLGWVLLTSRSRASRLEKLRAGIVAFILAELVAQVTKALTAQARPAAVVPDLDTHGYPSTPLGYTFPSAHTAATVGVVAALWPWMTPTQRVVGVVAVVLIGLNRIYIAAHWPLDILGGAGVGLVAGSAAWLVARRWPIESTLRRSG